MKIKTKEFKSHVAKADPVTGSRAALKTYIFKMPKEGSKVTLKLTHQSGDVIQLGSKAKAVFLWFSPYTVRVVRNTITDKVLEYSKDGWWSSKGYNVKNSPYKKGDDDIDISYTKHIFMLVEVKKGEFVLAKVNASYSNFKRFEQAYQQLHSAALLKGFDSGASVITELSANIETEGKYKVARLKPDLEIIEAVDNYDEAVIPMILGIKNFVTEQTEEFVRAAKKRAEETPEVSETPYLKEAVSPKPTKDIATTETEDPEDNLDFPLEDDSDDTPY